MTTSIREYCLANLKTTLEGIKTSSGYENTIASVQRYEQHDQSYASMPAIFIVENQEESEDKPDPYTTNVLQVGCVLFTSQDRSASTSTATLLNSLLQDVKKAIKVDNTRGKYAIDSEVTQNEPIEGAEDMPYVGFFFEVKITYRHLQTDPTSLG